MGRKVVISKLAENKLENLFNYLIENWSLKAKRDFVKKIDQFIDVIKEHPESFPESQIERGLHKCVITKQTTLYYRFDSKQIKVVTIFDTRQNPQKIKKDL
ncbi:type II toxin-antitoxin system RelE/ParE family toxin [Solitalea koreensis]|uniref:Plasmid stabilization system protein ParE n=1 Tax=Solitalea koreensis TaxID=543615 RepID=A0A521E7S1_9SPHI|nr:type II toxin-antitoxin system RelE/ParE family toxin [Solitalea koreensis]SMO79937.1 Plasmid stabilization system protein ParE [Solitalea koreensis]